jgi:hypothetical protein
MSLNLNREITVVGIDIGKNSSHVVVEDKVGSIGCDRSGRAARSEHGSPTCRSA